MLDLPQGRQSPNLFLRVSMFGQLVTLKARRVPPFTIRSDQIYVNSCITQSFQKSMCIFSSFDSSFHVRDRCRPKTPGFDYHHPITCIIVFSSSSSSQAHRHRI